MKEQFHARMLRIHFGEGDKWQNKPLHDAIVEKCRELGMAGAIVYKGIEGYGSSARIRHARALSRDAPIMVSIIDIEPHILRLLPHLDAMVEEGLIAMSNVEVIRYFRQEKADPAAIQKQANDAVR